MPPFDTLKTLPPKERLEKLKVLHEKLNSKVEKLGRDLREIELQEKSELLEIEKLIAESKEELKAENRLEKNPLLIMQNTISQASIEKTLTVEVPEKVTSTKRASKKERESQGLEEITTSSQTSTLTSQTIPHTEFSPHALPIELENAEYRVQLRETPMIYLRENMEHLYRSLQDKGYLRWEEQHLAEIISEAIDKKIHDYQTGAYTPPEPITDHVSITQKIAAKILGMQHPIPHSEQKDWYKG